MSGRDLRGANLRGDPAKTKRRGCAVYSCSIADPRPDNGNTGLVNVGNLNQGLVQIGDFNLGAVNIGNGRTGILRLGF